MNNIAEWLSSAEGERWLRLNIIPIDGPLIGIKESFTAEDFERYYEPLDACIKVLW
jgi:hypothetical protein